MKKKVDLFNVNKVNPQILNKEHFDKLFSKKHLTIGQKAADTLTKFAGSWTFILGFFIVFLSTPQGFFPLIIFPITVFMVLELWNLKKEIEEQIEKKLLSKMNTT